LNTPGSVAGPVTVTINNTTGFGGGVVTLTSGGNHMRQPMNVLKARFTLRYRVTGPSGRYKDLESRNLLAESALILVSDFLTEPGITILSLEEDY
jgi:hypothetical protein